jgi:hypothetical protein
MGLFRRKNEHAIPKPGTPEFDEAVQGTALPDDQSVSMGEEGWTKPGDEEVDQAGDDAQEQADGEERKRREKMLGALGRSVLRPPNAEGFGGGVNAPKRSRNQEPPEGE